MRGLPLLIASVSFFTHSNLAGQTSTDTPLPFGGPGDVVASSNVAVTGIATVGDVNVAVDITFPMSTGGLGVSLQSPAGTSVVLFQDACDGFADIQVEFDDEAAQLIGDVCPATGGGPFRPFEPLSAFDGESGNGTWTLSVGNFSSVTFGIDGTLNGWSNNVTPAGGPLTPAVQGIPTLSEWGIILLTLTLLGSGVYYLKKEAWVA